jgi:hypothetical protein
MVIALAARARCPRGDLPNIWICFGSHVAVPMWPPPCGRPPCGPPYVSESVGRSTSTSHTVDRMRWRWQAKRMKWWKRLGLRPLTTTWRRERVGIWVRLRRSLPRQRPGFAAWRKRAGKSGKSRGAGARGKLHQDLTRGSFLCRHSSCRAPCHGAATGAAQPRPRLGTPLPDVESCSRGPRFDCRGGDRWRRRP